MPDPEVGEGKGSRALGPNHVFLSKSHKNGGEERQRCFPCTAGQTLAGPTFSVWTSTVVSGARGLLNISNFKETGRGWGGFISHFFKGEADKDPARLLSIEKLHVSVTDHHCCHPRNFALLFVLSFSFCICAKRCRAVAAQVKKKAF